MEQTVKVKDRDGKDRTWMVEGETKNTYKIFLSGIITEIYKNGCYEINGQLYSIETRNSDYPNYKMWFDYQDEFDTEVDYGCWESEDYCDDLDMELEYEGWDNECQKAMYDYIMKKQDV